MLWLLALCLSALAGDLRVHVLDVGQGDSILLEASNGKRILIDAGTKSAGVAGMLKARGVDKIDLVISTHPHADHIGGMAEVLSIFRPKIFVDNGMRHTTLTYARTMSAMEKSGAAYRTAIQGRVFHVEDDLRLTVLHPRSRRLSGTRSDLNSNSVVVRIDHGKDCILLTGDSEDPTERSILQNGLAPCEVLKVAHHGSGHSTSAGWLRVLRPKIALISVGKDNRYGHPDPDTLARLKSAGVAVHRTDLEGTLTVVSTGKGVRVETSPATTVVATSTAAAPVYSGPSRLTATGQVNINQADVLTLDRLPGIGPARAASIIADREKNGPYSTCDELQRVRGIGPKTVFKLRPQCTTDEAEKPQ